VSALKAGLALLALAVVANWPMWSLDAWMGTEGRRVQIAVEMARSGDFMVPTLGLEPTIAKPPLHYWVLASLVGLFGAGPLAMRAPSVLSLWLCAWLAFLTLRRSHGERVGALAGAGVLCSPAVLYHAGFAEIDPLFAALTAGSLLLLARGVAFGGRAALAAAGLCGALALLTKGPPYAMFLAGAALVWLRHRRLRGLPWFLVPLVLPSVAYYTALRGGFVDPDTLADVAGRESVGRVFTYEWHHLVDLPMHFVRAFLVSLPFGLFAAAEHRGSHEARLEPAEVQQRVCIGAAVGAVLILALFPGRSVRYLLPGVPLFVCAVAPAVAAFARYPHELRSGQRAIPRVLGLAGAIALCALPFLPFPLPWRSLGFAAVLAIAPWFVITRASLVGYALAIPVLAMWTIVADRMSFYERGVRSSADVEQLLVEELGRRGAWGDVATWGHVVNAYLLAAPQTVPGDEYMTRSPQTRYLVVEHRDGTTLEAPDGYVERVRIRARRRTVVLLEREP
jgi:4-amino-4-deoxy-L-arabinose transferase-like glycosyltransferase